MKGQCIICNSEELEKLKTTKIEVFSTGDRKKFDADGKKIERVICKCCGTIQFLQNSDYVAAIDEVYKNYDVMRDKMWLADEKGHKPRLQVVYEEINKAIHLSETGNMLDIGCGGGEALSQFGELYPEWDLYGMDIGEQFRKSVIERKKVKIFFTSLEEITESHVKFDFITINNVLSLADNPAQILKTVHGLLTDEGIFFVKDSDFEVHPFLLYEIESCAFYTKAHMEKVLRKFEFDIMDTKFELEKKEIGIFSRKSNELQASYQNSYELNKKIYNRKIEYLDSIIDTVKRCVEKNVHIGIFGTSIAGVWLSEIVTKGAISLVDRQIFYIEEDEDFRQKKTGVNGYPIYRLEEVTEHAVIFLPFPKYIAENIKRRCEKKYKHLDFIIFE